MPADAAEAACRLKSALQILRHECTFPQVGSVHPWHHRCMARTITQFRRELFALADAALEGKTVEFVHRGKTLRVVPEEVPDKFARITPMPELIDENMDWEAVSRELLAEMEREWEKDWADL